MPFSYTAPQKGPQSSRKKFPGLVQRVKRIFPRALCSFQQFLFIENDAVQQNDFLLVLIKELILLEFRKRMVKKSDLSKGSQHCEQKISAGVFNDSSKYNLMASIKKDL